MNIMSTSRIRILVDLEDLWIYYLAKQLYSKQFSLE